MNEKSIPRIRVPDSNPQLNRITFMLGRAQGSLRDGRGGVPTYSELEEMTGVANGTVKGWFANNGRPTAEFLIQLLERLPERTTQEILVQACRLCPMLDHLRLECGRTVINQATSRLQEASSVGNLVLLFRSQARSH